MIRGLLAALGLALLPGAAEAHLVGVEFGDTYAGGLHLLTDPGQVAALLSLALAGAAQPPETARWMLLALPLGLAAGLALALSRAHGVPLDPLVALALALPGILAVAALRLSEAQTAALAFAVAAVLGHTNGAGVAGVEIDIALYGFGALCAGTVLGTLALAAATALRRLRPWTPLAQRVLASWMTAVGSVYFGLTVVG